MIGKCLGAQRETSRNGFSNSLDVKGCCGVFSGVAKGGPPRTVNHCQTAPDAPMDDSPQRRSEWCAVEDRRASAIPAVSMVRQLARQRQQRQRPRSAARDHSTSHPTDSTLRTPHAPGSLLTPPPPFARPRAAAHR
uniref:IstF protein n=1 Tax=Streptomyces tenjimariensis TaxID=29308 RepID=Q2UZD8_9ACTN|nr:IstF protein [Streptomyces tenjimariensis]